MATFIDNIKKDIKNKVDDFIEHDAEREDMDIRDYIAETPYDHIFTDVSDRLYDEDRHQWHKDDKYDRADLIRNVSKNLDELIYIIGGSRFNDYELYTYYGEKIYIWDLYYDSVDDTNIDFSVARDVLCLAEGALIDEYCLDLADKYGVELNEQ